MAYVKLDTGILDSSLWVNRDDRDIFLTALLMAVPHEVLAPTPAVQVRALDPLGYTVPPGWYGLVSGAGVGIARRAGMSPEEGLAALERLAEVDPESRTPDHEGRRLVRVPGGYLVLNFMRYRDRDTTAAERMKRYRARLKERPQLAPTSPPVSDAVTRNGDGVTNPFVTQAVSSKQEAVSSKQEEKEEDSNAVTPPSRSVEPPAVRSVLAVVPEPPAVVLDGDPVRAKLAATPTGPSAVAAYDHFRSRAHSPHGVSAELEMLANGGRELGTVSWDILAQALHEFRLTNDQLASRGYRAFVKRLVEEARTAKQRPAPVADDELRRLGF